jgi:hypothetical protein
VLATLIGSVVAVVAVAMAVVFGASLTGLLTNPARYGWNWTLLMDTRGRVRQLATRADGQARQRPAGGHRLVDLRVHADPHRRPDRARTGADPALGSVAPPTTSGHPIAGPGQIELGVATLRQLGKRVGDTVTVGSGRARRALTIVGTVTLPSIGLTIADHVSLGRGAMLADSTLLAAQGPSRWPVIGSRRWQARGGHSRLSLGGGDRPGTRRQLQGAGGQDQPRRSRWHPGGTYRLPQNRIQGAAILDAARMGSQPLVLALAVAAGAVLSLALALLASVRQRRRELALLKALGLTRRQVMAAVAWQASVILVVAVLVGGPLGVAAGHWAWAAFASSLGAVPVTVVPLPPCSPRSWPCWWRETCWPPVPVRSRPGPGPRPCSGPNSAAGKQAGAAVPDRMGPWNPSTGRSPSCWRPTGSRRCCGSPP